MLKVQIYTFTNNWTKYTILEKSKQEIKISCFYLIASLKYQLSLLI